jgi:hypothetical protein
MIDTYIGNRSDAIRLVAEMLEKADRKDGGIIADIKEGLEALLDALRRDVI